MSRNEGIFIRRVMAYHVRFGTSCVVVLATTIAAAQPAIERNVIFGMYSGTALLMDVYKPVKSNHRAVVVIPGSAWYMPQRYDATALTDKPDIAEFSRKLASNGSPYS
jgi:hypothetical protein